MVNIKRVLFQTQYETDGTAERAEADAITVIGIVFAVIMLIAALWLFSWAHSMMTSEDTVEKVMGIFAGPGLIALGVTILGGMVAIIVALIRRN